MDFINVGVSQYIKYSAILLCLVASIILLFKKKHYFCKVFTIFAMIFTCISDYFLLLSRDNSLFIVGISTFLCAQLCYFLLINKIRNFKYFFIDLIFRILLTSIFLIVAFIINLDAMTLMAGVYFIELFMNFISSFTLIKVSKKLIILPIAFFLFILCDINVGLNNIGIQNEVASFIIFYLMWLFYLPSQVILSTNTYFLE